MVALVLIIMMLVAGAQSLFASEKTYVEKVTIVPSFGFRHIDGTASGTEDRNGFGPGLEVAYDRILSPELSAGLSMSAEHFFFKDYFRYTDIKVSANVKIQIVPMEIKDARARLYFCGGIGADFVFRSDADFATYFMLRPGLQLNVETGEGRDFVVSLWSALNVRGEEMVFHGSVGIGLAFAFGEPERAKEAEKPIGPQAVVAPAEEPVAETPTDVELPPIVLPEAQPAEEPVAEEPAAEPEPVVEPEAEPVVEPAAEEPAVEEPVAEEPAAEPEPVAEPEVVEVVVVEPAEAGVEIVVVEPEKAEPVQIAMRPYHTEQVSYISDSVEVDEVSTYMVGDVEIEKHRIYHKDIVVTRTVIVWDD